MCGGGGGDDYSEDLRQQEEERKRKLEQGMRELEQVFAPYYGEERTYTGPLSQDSGVMTQDQFLQQLQAAFEPGSTVAVDPGEQQAPAPRPDQNTTAGPTSGYPQEDSRPGPTSGYQGNAAGTTLNTQQLQDLGLSQAQIEELQGYQTAGTLEDELAGFGGDVYSDLRYGEDYYTTTEAGTPAWEDVRSAYMDFANPQLQRQYGSGAEDLTYALARGGQLTGTVGADRWNDLNQQFATRKQDVASTAEGYADERRQQILDLETQYQNMLRSSSDPSLEGTNIDRQLTQFASMPEFSSLGPLFQNTTAGLAAGYGGQQAYGTNQAVNNIMSGRGVYGRDPNASSGRVVR